MGSVVAGMAGSRKWGVVAGSSWLLGFCPRPMEILGFWAVRLSASQLVRRETLAKEA